MKKVFYLIGLFVLLTSFSCENNIDKVELIEDDVPIDLPIDNTNNNKNLKILALGDSYTIGQSVCETCKFPEQLKDSLLKKLDSVKTIDLKVIARTGWTTTNLISAIKNETISSDYELVTLLIGVNNQYQNKSFSIYELEFPELLEIATKAANGNKNNIIVVSIPDYAFSPFGNGNKIISTEIDKYNDFAKNYCSKNNITFVNITEITRQGLVDKSLVASDGLHPSKIAYSKFVSELLPEAIKKLD